MVFEIVFDPPRHVASLSSSIAYALLRSFSTDSIGCQKILKKMSGYMYCSSNVGCGESREGYSGDKPKDL